MGREGNQEERPKGGTIRRLRVAHNRSREQDESAASSFLYGISDLVSLAGGANVCRWPFSRLTRTPYTDWENLETDLGNVIQYIEVKVPATTWKEVELDKLRTELIKRLLEHDTQLIELSSEAEPMDVSLPDDPPSAPRPRIEEIEISK